MTKTSRSRKAEKQADEQDYKENKDQEHDHDQDLEANEQVDLYQEMGVNAAATTVEIKSAYRKLALKYHPDKQVGKSKEEQEASVATFQKLALYYECLVDPVKRERYDKTGIFSPASDSIDREDGVSWKEYFDSILTKLTPSAIDEYEKIYKYSEEERQDVFAAYTKTKGLLLDMIDMIPLCSLSDLDRFKLMCQDAIDSGELEKLKKFPIVSARDLKIRREVEERERKEAEKSTYLAKGEKADKGGGLDGLKQLMRAGQKERTENLIDSLEKKYASKSSKSSSNNSTKPPRKRKADHPGEELDDEAFQALQAKLFPKKKK